MKKLLLIVLMLTAIFAKAQTSVYHPFPESNAIWNVDYTCCWGNSCLWYPNEEQYSYTFGSDTTISGSIYHKVYRPYTDHVYDCFPLQNAAGYVGSIRQDTSLRKVFIVPPDSINETLLYDFNLQVGDTITGYLLHWITPNGPPIINIDSVLIGSNYRKRWEWEWMGTDHGYLIEGIGSSLGLLEWIMQNFDAPITTLLCFQQDGQTLYPDSTTSCQLINSVREFSGTDLSLSISPNPFHTDALLKLPPEFENAEMNIYCPPGILVGKEKINQQSLYRLDRKELANGIYFMQLVNVRGQVANGKFIVQ